MAICLGRENGGTCTSPHLKDAKACRGCRRCSRLHKLKLGKDGYCDECRTQLLDKGYSWSDYFADYKPSDVAIVAYYGWNNEA